MNPSFAFLWPLLSGPENEQVRAALAVRISPITVIADLFSPWVLSALYRLWISDDPRMLPFKDRRYRLAHFRDLLPRTVPKSLAPIQHSLGVTKEEARLLKSPAAIDFGWAWKETVDFIAKLLPLFPRPLILFIVGYNIGYMDTDMVSQLTEPGKTPRAILVEGKKKELDQKEVAKRNLRKAAEAKEIAAQVTDRDCIGASDESYLPLLTKHNLKTLARLLDLSEREGNYPAIEGIRSLIARAKTLLPIAQNFAQSARDCTLFTDHPDQTVDYVEALARFLRKQGFHAQSAALKSALEGSIPDQADGRLTLHQARLLMK